MKVETRNLPVVPVSVGGVTVANTTGSPFHEIHRSAKGEERTAFGSRAVDFEPIAARGIFRSFN